MEGDVITRLERCSFMPKGSSESIFFLHGLTMELRFNNPEIIITCIHKPSYFNTLCSSVLLQCY